MIGLTIGRYTITAKLGEGGMGEVYRARDGKLGRDVALKVLPVAFARTPSPRAFRARSADARHPEPPAHRADLRLRAVRRDVGARHGLVEGDDLSGRLRRGPIPMDEAIEIARQVAAALEAAHEIGIVHRDLKPANIKLKPRVRLRCSTLDWPRRSTPARRISNTAAITSPALTQAGVILGTAAYMSPEQARGQHLDKRTDIWAFGVVVLEMLTGKRTFGGDTVSDAIAAVLTQEPDWSQLPTAIHPHVTDVIRRCLRKDPRRRLRDMGDALVDSTMR